MKRLGMRVALVLLCVCAPIRAQLYGVSPYQNGPTPINGSLYVFDPETLTWIDGVEVRLSGFSITGVMGIAIHPNLPPPNHINNGRLYAILELGAVNGHVLATIDPITGNATQVGNLGDKFFSIAFGEDGQLFGVTEEEATVPETLYKIDKSTASKTVAFTMGNGDVGEVIAYNPVDDFIYHWSGGVNLVFEKIAVNALTYTPTNIPVVGTTSGETFGAVYDPCKPYEFGAGNFQFGFTTSNISGSFNAFSAGGNVLSAFGIGVPDAIRGLALVGGYSCEADLGVGMAASAPALNTGDALVLDIVVDNAGDARARNPSLTLTLPPSLSAATTTGCSEDPDGIPTCTPKIFVQRYVEPTGYQPLQLSSLWKGRATTVTINATYDGGGGSVVATTTSLATEISPADNTASYILGNALFSNSFEN